jgi:3-oxoacyl-[acyl-carrier-protein] synthase-1
MAGPPPAVVGFGAVSPVGLSAPATCSALRAGIARLKALATHVVDGPVYAKQPVVGGRVPTEWFEGEPEPAEWPGHDRFRAPHPPERDDLVASGLKRLVELARPAAIEAWESAGLGAPEPRGLGVYLGVGEGDDAEGLAGVLFPSVGVPEVVKTNAAGRSAALVALHDAVADLRDKRVTTALVGGVDSQVRTEVLRRLDAAGALNSATNPHGIQPGEAAAFLVLVSPDTAAQRRMPVRAVVAGTAVAAEPTVGTEEPNKAEGLSRAIREARAAAPPLASKPLVVCDLNGERYRGLEWTFALVRALSDLPGDDAIWHPADCIGDAGAGLGGLDLVWAALALHRRYAGTDRALVWGASDGAERACAILAGLHGEGGN